MMELWESLGFIRWPLLFSLGVVVLLAAWSCVRLVDPRASADLRTKAWLDAILFWGGFAMIAGVLGTLIGVILAARAIETAGSVSASLAWGGLRIALLSSAAGVLIFSLAALLWFGLQMRWRLLEARAFPEVAPG